jgi:5-(carboxyamino)imidazole ribonucleotide synthase
MLAFEAKRMGYSVTVLDPTPHSPAGQVCDAQITASFQDAEAIRALAAQSDVLTYEFEHIHADILCTLESEGTCVVPSGNTLKCIQNKYMQKTRLQAAGLPVPAFMRIDGRKDIDTAAEVFGYPVVLKTCTGGYDGKGNYVIQRPKEADIGYAALGANRIPLMAEAFVPFDRELSILAARDAEGRCVLYPIADNLHEGNILRRTQVPASLSNAAAEAVTSAAQGVLQALDDAGLFCIELFLTGEDRVYINEIAPRPHNSGHYTIEACYTSQYEQLLRIMTGLPLGSARLRSPAVMLNLLGDDQVRGGYAVTGYAQILSKEGVYPHLYGKAATQPLKKIGHITVLGDTLKDAAEKADSLLQALRFTPLDGEEV